MSGNSLDGRRWRTLAQQIKARDGYRCLACGSTDDLTVDHIIALDTMTPDQWDDDLPYDPDNLATLCRSCNSSKGNRATLRVTWINPRWLDLEDVTPVAPQLEPDLRTTYADVKVVNKAIADLREDLRTPGFSPDESDLPRPDRIPHKIARKHPRPPTQDPQQP